MNPRLRVNLRHMQSLLGEDADQDEDFRIQLEAAYLSDRYFLEEYYKRLFDTGLDQETLAYLIRQKHNWAWSIWTEANLQNFYTDTQWLPRFDYYRLGDAVFNKWFTYDQHTGLDYANTHTAAEVNNPFIFAFMPYDPISNTSGTFQSGRFYTNHELDLPLNFANILRVVPYVQGQAVGWTNQINGQATGRVWGAAGARLDFMVWKKYPNVESELFNVHGLNNKISFEADYRDAYSNVKLQRLGVQDDLDDNTYESTRRYFALTNYGGGVLPPQYDPRHLILRRVLSPITGPTDIQASIETLQLNIHQRLQTKRGPEGRRRVIDYMTLDATTTYFPYASRDNFSKPFGQNMYNWQWFVGDRTSVISYGWFEFFDITGKPIFATNTGKHNNPFGLNVITSGISISRPPRGNVYIGYTVLDTGPINTSALNDHPVVLAQPEMVRVVFEHVRLRQRDPAVVLFRGDADRLRLPDLDRPERRPAAATATCSRSRSRRGSARTSGSARASGRRNSTRGSRRPNDRGGTTGRDWASSASASGRTYASRSCRDRPRTRPRGGDGRGERVGEPVRSPAPLGRASRPAEHAREGRRRVTRAQACHPRRFQLLRARLSVHPGRPDGRTAGRQSLGLVPPGVRRLLGPALRADPQRHRHPGAIDRRP